MVLDPTTRESNFRDSIKKFFIDNLKTIEGIDVTFDISLSSPKIQGQPHQVKKWISVNFGDIDTEEAVSEGEIIVIPCTRGDAEGYQLTHLRDRVMGYLTNPGTITLYRSYPAPWVEIGGMKVFVGVESQQMEAEDSTKFKRIPVLLKWGSRL